VTGLLIRWGRRVRRQIRAVIGYRALARQYETDLAAAEATIGNLEVTIGKLSAELVLNRREYAALEVRAQELIGRIRDLERVNAELRASIDAAFDAGATFEREHRLGPGGQVRHHEGVIDIDPEPGWAPHWMN
jgi:chromosome segregation ATPase